MNKMDKSSYLNRSSGRRAKVNELIGCGNYRRRNSLNFQGLFTRRFQSAEKIICMSHKRTGARLVEIMQSVHKWSVGAEPIDKINSQLLQELNMACASTGLLPWQSSWPWLTP
jgi:hypothetical protein